MKSMRRGASFLLVRSNLTRFIHNDNDAKRRHCVSFAVSPLNENEKRELTGENNLDIAKKTTSVNDAYGRGILVFTANVPKFSKLNWLENGHKI